MGLAELHESGSCAERNEGTSPIYS